MPRVNKTVRLAYETKLWIDELISKKELELREEINKGLIPKLEKHLFENSTDILNGVSCNVVLKVTSGSIIEQAYRNTRHYTNDEWKKVVRNMERSLKEVNMYKETTVTPRLYLDEDILTALESYQDEWRSKEPGKRLIKLSYVIKVVVFADYYNNFNKNI
ncbi:hypothetical protein [Vagococcus zengguangii]|uniref:Uncharacterized protein n=1 Tax=Vagococcus zengguangii TaxID=2571750 RepID=A0A4D7CN59_9ENTE|nr:hypothetical protein [Vagococcus zengguangii]QCI85538.1 hypothetical protein FA707_00500 [Vagococcus zengguangii]TLG80084.1 hypothetical protein FE258_07055 [Vagococcus zengguangii]